MTITQRVMVANPESSYFGKIGRVTQQVATVVWVAFPRGLTLPFGLCEVVIAPPKRRR
jgi:hypothetical protein